MPRFSLLLLSLCLPLLAAAATDADRQIEETATSSFNFRIALENHVKISVEDGLATLTGKVGLEEQRRLAEDTVLSIPGIAAVDNQVTVKGEREGSDAWKALKVRSRMLAKRDVSLVDIRVDVKDGVVILTGFADDEAQKFLTEEYARDFDGIVGIQNQIEVRPEDAPRLRTCELLDDCSIIGQIRYELSFYPPGSGRHARFASQEGHVVITGEVASGAERELLTRVAKSVRGVDSVSNEAALRSR